MWAKGHRWTQVHTPVTVWKRKLRSGASWPRVAHHHQGTILPGATRKGRRHLKAFCAQHLHAQVLRDTSGRACFLTRIRALS